MQDDGKDSINITDSSNVDHSDQQLPIVTRNIRDTNIVGLFAPGSMVSNHDPLNLAQRQRFVEVFSKYYPNLTLTLDTLGVKRNQYLRALETFPDFKEAIQEIEESRADEIEGYNYEYAKLKTNFMDRIAYLRKVRKERWNPDGHITVEHKITPEEAKSRIDKLTNIVDAEIVGAPQVKKLK